MFICSFNALLLSENLALFWPRLILISKTNQFRKLIYIGCILFNFVNAKKDAVI